MSISLETMQKAIKRLEEGIETQKKYPDFDIVRDGLIQRFEFNFEIARKILRRFLEQEDGTRLPLGEKLIRKAWEERLLLNNNEKWLEYTRLRNLTSHEYGQEKAEEIIAAIPGFLEEIQFLEKQIRERGGVR